MIEVFTDANKKEVLVHSSCVTPEDFLLDLAAVLAKLERGNSGLMLNVLQSAMPIAFKLSGYKADEVRETRTLTCGQVMPTSKQLLVSTA